MVPDSIDNHEISSGSKNTYRNLKRLVWQCGGECDWPERRIAAHLGIARGTYRGHRRELESAGLIELERRRRGGCRQNDTNILRIVEGGSKTQPQKLKPDVNTSTTAAREVSREGSTYARERWEHNRAMNHPPAMRRLYEENGALQAENRILRKHHKWGSEREKGRNVGRYDGLKVEMSLDQVNALRAKMGLGPIMES